MDNISLWAAAAANRHRSKEGPKVETAKKRPKDQGRQKAKFTKVNLSGTKQKEPDETSDVHLRNQVDANFQKRNLWWETNLRNQSGALRRVANPPNFNLALAKPSLDTRSLILQLVLGSCLRSFCASLFPYVPFLRRRCWKRQCRGRSVSPTFGGETGPCARTGGGFLGVPDVEPMWWQTLLGCPRKIVNG